MTDDTAAPATPTEALSETRSGTRPGKHVKSTNEPKTPRLTSQTNFLHTVPITDRT